MIYNRFYLLKEQGSYVSSFPRCYNSETIVGEFVKFLHKWWLTDDGLYDQKAFYKVEIVFYLSSVNDDEFINYCLRIV